MPNIRINESQLLLLASKARIDNVICGFLHKRSADTAKWQQRWFALYQNILFYYENDQTTRPSGVALLEGCYCERIITPSSSKGEKQFCFAIYYKKEGQRQYDLRTDTDTECTAWIEAIRNASYARLVEQKEQLEQKHLHLLQILDSERQSKWHYVQQTEELHEEVKKLKAELKEYKSAGVPSSSIDEEESDEIKKIKKVQSFFRGWLCRRRWKQIVDEYIRSPHAESMRKRNSIVFGMVEGEEEYVKDLSAMVSCFLRPLRMAASSKKPPVTHEDVNSIFLNSETLLFLHQIFLKGLTARMENWPTLVLGDLFDMLLPMLGIYQEYVRNHHYSLQVLAEYKQKPEFNALLKRYEEKPITEARVLETFLTYPMHQIPRYIVTLHDLLAHTPHDHVERKSLEFAKSKLEELSRIMHDEVSETENIRKNLAIERMIVEGCDILLDVNQTFVRQGTLLQVYNEKPKPSRGRLGSFSSSFKETKKEIVRQVFLFTNHCLLATRASNGRLHLAKHYGKIPLIDCTLVEDSSSDLLTFDDETSSSSSMDSNLCNVTTQSGGSSNMLSTQSCEKGIEQKVDHFNGLDFRIIVDCKSGPPVTITLVASTVQDKAAWCSDISQCVENLHYSDLLNSSMSDTSSVTMPQSVRSDPRLFRDDYDIKYSRTLNSCKVPQIRHASVDRLLDRLTDLRFLSIDFLNTFLLTYRVFTNGQTVLDALKRVARNPECGNIDASSSQLCDSDVFQSSSSVNIIYEDSPVTINKLRKPKHEKLRRISTGSMRIEVTGETTESSQDSDSRGDADGSDSSEDDVITNSEVAGLLFPPKRKLAPIASCETLSDSSGIIPSTPTSLNSTEGNFTIPANMDFSADLVADTPRITLQDANMGESSTDSLLPPDNCLSTMGSSCDTLVGSPVEDTVPEILLESEDTSQPSTSPPPTVEFNSLSRRSHPQLLRSHQVTPVVIVRPDSSDEADTEDNTTISVHAEVRRSSSPNRPSSPLNIPTQPRRASSPLQGQTVKSTSPTSSNATKRSSSPIIYSFSSPNVITGMKNKHNKRLSGDSHGESIVSLTSTRGSLAVEDTVPSKTKAGTVVTSSRASKRRYCNTLVTVNKQKSANPSLTMTRRARNWGNPKPKHPHTLVRRSSSSAATMAFAAATAGMATPQGHPKGINRYHSAGAGDLKPYLVNRKRESVISTAATMRVLNVLRHWVSKHSQDFETDPGLKAKVRDMLEEMVCNTSLLPAEHKAAASILRTMAKEDADHHRVDLDGLLATPLISSKDTFDSLSALDIAEQLTYLDHQIFMNIRSEELLCQAWMKPEKARKAQHVLLVSTRFNEVSRLVVSEIIKRHNMIERVAAIEKWAAIADICRCMHNYNGVLQICAAFVNSSVYRLKKTWDRLSKQTKQMIEKLQTLVASDGRFKNMRDALHRCDPPCIPYLGMYLTDLSFIEESTPNITDESLVNYSKMRMIAHVIREIQQFQQTPYKIEHHPRVTNYLLDPTKLLGEDETYRTSLCIEPRQSRVSMTPSI